MLLKIAAVVCFVLALLVHLLVISGLDWVDLFLGGMVALALSSAGIVIKT
jgi:hypothetical protein